MMLKVSLEEYGRGHLTFFTHPEECKGSGPCNGPQPASSEYVYSLGRVGVLVMILVGLQLDRV